MHRELVPREEVAAEITTRVVEVKVKVKARVKAKDDRTKMEVETTNLNSSSRIRKIIRKRLSALDVVKMATRLPSVLIEKDRPPKLIKLHLPRTTTTTTATMGPTATRHKPVGMSDLPMFE